VPAATQISLLGVPRETNPAPGGVAQNESLFVSRGSVGLSRVVWGALRALWLYRRLVARGLPRGRVWPSSCRTSRSFVLASLRALHLDLRRRRRQGSSDRDMTGSALDGRAAGLGRSVVTGPGSGLSEEPVPGVQAGRAGCRAVPLLWREEEDGLWRACCRQDRARARVLVAPGA